MRHARIRKMSESGQLTYTKADAREEWEHILAARRRLVEMEADFVFMAQFLRRKGRGDWIPADALSLLTRTTTANTGEGRHKGGGRVGKAPAERGTWTSEIMVVVGDHPNGIGSSGVREALSRGEFAERFSKNPAGFYNAVSKLEAKGDMVKYRGHYFTKAHMSDFLARVRRGEVPDLSESQADKPTILDMLGEFLDKYPEGASANQIATAMEANGMSRGTVYNNLSKAVMKRRVRREGKLYFPPETNKPPQ